MSKTIKTNINSVEWYVRRQEFTHTRMHETIAPLNPCTNCEAVKCMEHATYLVTGATVGPGACSAPSEAPATPTLPAAPSRWYTQSGPCAKPGSSGCSVTAASGDSVPQNNKHITVPRKADRTKQKSGTGMEGRGVAMESHCTDVHLLTGRSEVTQLPTTCVHADGW